MKRIIVFFAVLFCIVSARAQVTISDRYYVNRAKAEIKAEEAAKETKVIVVGAKEGILSYVIRDGKRIDYQPKAVDREEPEEYVWYIPLSFELPKEEAKQEEAKVDENAFAKLLQELYADGWSMVMSYGTSSGEVYIFEKRVAKAKQKQKAVSNEAAFCLLYFRLEWSNNHHHLFAFKLGFGFQFANRIQIIKQAHQDSSAHIIGT